MWKHPWGNLYPEGSQSRKIIDHVFDSYYLVNLVDNDFPKESCLWKIVEQMLEAGRKTSSTIEEMDISGQWYVSLSLSLYLPTCHHIDKLNISSYTILVKFTLATEKNAKYILCSSITKHPSPFFSFVFDKDNCNICTRSMELYFADRIVISLCVCTDLVQPNLFHILVEYFSDRSKLNSCPYISDFYNIKFNL